MRRCSFLFLKRKKRQTMWPSMFLINTKPGTQEREIDNKRPETPETPESHESHWSRQVHLFSATKESVDLYVNVRKCVKERVSKNKRFNLCLLLVSFFRSQRKILCVLQVEMGNNLIVISRKQCILVCFSILSAHSLKKTSAAHVCCSLLFKTFIILICFILIMGLMSYWLFWNE